MAASDYARIEQAIRFLETNFRRQPGLDEVAAAAGLSPFHFQRLFTRWAGISPKRFLQFLTAENARALLANSASVLDAAYASGLSGPGRLHDLVVNVYAVTPGELKSAGEGIAIRYGTVASPFGDCLLAITARGICGLAFLSGSDPEEFLASLAERWGRATLVEDGRAVKAVAERVFAPPGPGGGLPLTVAVRGSNFQVKVWEALVRIPPGCVVSYETIAGQVGSPRAVRAVGSAVARNDVAYLIPCHRVIRKTGAFANYRWGETRKKAILAWESAYAFSSVTRVS
ncbi:MAG TPA: methylated-DNA--[protein]-cysteine S-methyltransferase [Candidatus Deferrimicrobiaceae bacterium]|jgi:AraC family transcriptional regulator of adaptative response/methylated-DNA-[protein]-cysteine methyltransferase